MKKNWMVAALVLAGAPGIAPAQDANAVYMRSLAATCANCHGTNGKAVPGATVVGLAGLSRDHIVERMRAFKSATPPAGTPAPTIMHQIAKGYTDEQILQLAAYFAAQPK